MGVSAVLEGRPAGRKDVGRSSTGHAERARHMNLPWLLAGLFLGAGGSVWGQTPAQVLVVVNGRSAESKEIGQYYIQKRGIPLRNLCTISTTSDEMITRDVYDKEIEAPIAKFLTTHGLQESILYIVTMSGVPLTVRGNSGEPQMQDSGAAVDSELALLYGKLHGAKVSLPGPIANPFFKQRDTPFRHPTFPIYLVCRLAAWNMAEMKGLVDKSLAAKNKGMFVVDMRGDENTPGNSWLRTAALLLPKERLVADDSPKVLMNEKDVIGYASWGSNDKDRKTRFLHNQWLPGAIATEFVSTDGRSFKKPPEKWEIGSWGDPQSTWFAGAPQTLTSDFIHDGVSGASGQVSEPFLAFCPRPEFVLPAYYSGRNLAESFYMGIPGLSWMTVVIGDPLMHLQ
jgi:uncharacterized protein (TIGR03790 family)